MMQFREWGAGPHRIRWDLIRIRWDQSGSISSQWGSSNLNLVNRWSSWSINHLLNQPRPHWSENVAYIKNVPVGAPVLIWMSSGLPAPALERNRQSSAWRVPLVSTQKGQCSHTYCISDFPCRHPSAQPLGGKRMMHCANLIWKFSLEIDSKPNSNLAVSGRLSKRIILWETEKFIG